jgi:hypothetical protein
MLDGEVLYDIPVQDFSSYSTSALKRCPRGIAENFSVLSHSTLARRDWVPTPARGNQNKTGNHSFHQFIEQIGVLECLT